MSDTAIYEPGDVPLQSGRKLRGAKLAYKTFGTLNSERTNAVIVPTFYAGQHTDNEWLIGPGNALDPGTYFIIVPNMFGNGVSSSPSNTPPPNDRARFPNVTIYDNVRMQHRLVTEKFGIRPIALVVGFSMAGQQANQWAALYPDMVERILPFCGSAKCSPHNYVFLDGVKAALTTDAAWAGGLVQGAAGKGHPGARAGMGRVGLLAGLLSRGPLPRAGVRLGRGFRHRLLGGELPGLRRQ